DRPGVVLRLVHDRSEDHGYGRWRALRLTKGMNLNLRATVARLLNGSQKRALKSKLNAAKQRLVRTLLSYDGAQLQARLRKMGITDSDTVLVHANFEPDNGFRGAPADLVNALAELIGQRGNLLMMSIPFRGSA